MSDLAALLTGATARLAAAGVASPRVDAELLAAFVWGVPVGELRVRAWAGHDVDDAGSHPARFEAAVARRASRVPLQHITGVAPFRGLELLVGPGVFVPRPETEVTAGVAIDAAREAESRAVGPSGEPLGADWDGPWVVDLGTGSLAIAAAVASEVPAARVWAVESDPVAYAWAQRNLARLGWDGPGEAHTASRWGPMLAAVGKRAGQSNVPPRDASPASRVEPPRAGTAPDRRRHEHSERPASGMELARGGTAASPTPAASLGRLVLLLADAAMPPAGLTGTADVVVSNPPYIPDGARPLDPEVAEHDPPAALYGGGADGLEVPASIVQVAARLLRPGGVAVIEHGADQGEPMRRLAQEAGFARTTTIADLAGRDRILRAVRPH